VSIIITAPDGFSIRVVGIPAPQGSKRYVGRAGGKGVLVESSARAKPWRAKVTDAAAEAWAGQEAIDAPIVLTAIFAFPRPASHFGARGNLKASAPPYPSGHIGDLSKLIRSIEDSLTEAGVWRDDARVVAYGMGTGKVWAGATEPPNVLIRVEVLR